MYTGQTPTFEITGASYRLEITHVSNSYELIKEKR